jgi:Transposase IS4
MEAPRRSGRTFKPKKHYESTPYPNRKPRSAPPKPQTVLQPIPAESAPASDSPSTGTPPVTFPQFTPIAIKQHAAEVRTGGLQDAFQLFSLFFCPKLLNVMVSFTNSYARRNHTSTKHPWKSLSLPELYVWLDCVIYMGVHPEPHIDYYWRTESSAGSPRHVIGDYIGSTRFHQIRRHLTVVDREKGTHLSNSWYAPLEPLIFQLREAFRAYLLPGTNIAVDEAMAKAKGRSNDISILPGKPIPEGFKVWICAYHGYVYAFELHSRESSAERSSEPRPVIPQSMYLQAFYATNPNKQPPKTPQGGHRLAETQALCYRFANDLPRGYSWILYLDNLFINQPLLALLRKNLGMGAIGTTRKNARGIPKELLDMKEKKHLWGSSYPMVVGEVLVTLWQDNAPLVFITTAHSLEHPDDLVLVNRRRPTLNPTNRPIIEPVFGTQARKELLIPRPINDYNHSMGAGDEANQLRMNYDLQRRNRRTWRALFFFFLKTSIVNAYHLQQWGGCPPDENENEDEDDSLIGRTAAHRKFREDLITALWSYASETGPSAPLEITHEWLKQKSRYRKCVQCRAEGHSRLPKGKAVYKRSPLGELSGNRGGPSRSSWGCKQCGVVLCREGDCWEEYHPLGG